MRRRTNIRLTKERDIPLLRFLWKWKLGTSATLCQKFFGSAKPHTGYKRLLTLKQGRFIDIRCDRSGNHSFWVLDKRGFEAIKDSLPPLKEEGFRSENLTHDHLVMCTHLGDFLFEKPKNIGIVTEQQLRRVEEEAFPDWIPKSTLHRPDGYWRIENESDARTIALEVELSPKKKSDYELIGSFYATEEIDQVLWVTEKGALSNRILSSVCGNDPDEKAIHSVVHLSQFRKSGWDALVERGLKRGDSIRSLLGIREGNTSGTSTEHVPIQILLNTMKSPHRSKTYELLQSSQKPRLTPDTAVFSDRPSCKGEARL